MKRFFSTVMSVVLTVSVFSANSPKLSAAIYNDASADPESMNYICVLDLEGKPLALYDYAQQNGVDKFIFTEDGKTAYETLMTEHAAVMDSVNACIGRTADKLYDYTAVYDGISIILSQSEYKTISENKDNIGIEDIYISNSLSGNETTLKNSSVNASKSLSYSDLTDDILNRCGISDSGYKGDSTVIAVIDNEFDTAHEFISSMPENTVGRIDQEFIENVSPFLSSAAYDGNDIYLNEKIPYRFNYAEHNTDTYSDTLSHGTHVAGIAAGNGAAETDEKYDAKGTAPNAQLLLMSSSLSNNELIAAYDDCAFLGADVVNASYGAALTPTDVEPYMSEALANLTGTGIVFCSAAGNSGKLSFEGKDSLLNPDYSTGGIPDGSSSALTIASADNTNKIVNLISAGSDNYVISSASNSIIEALGGTDADIVIIPGVGEPKDFNEIDVKGKVAVIRRGDITFEEKAENAKAAGAKGVIFFNNIPNDKQAIIVQCDVLPSGIISYEDGLKLIASGETKIKILADNQIISTLNTNISSFSSWDYTEKLVLKPDITAYGGNIVSSVHDGKYEFMSGTSMATPQMSGMTALLKEYLKSNKEKYGIKYDSDYSELIARLMMSTATPVYRSDGISIASPRVQGSGIANVKNAIDTPAYLYTESEKDNFRPKLSLGDNLDKNIGNIEFEMNQLKFHIKNISDKQVTYSLSAELFSDSVSNGSLDTDVLPLTKSSVQFNNLFSEINTITVAPGTDEVVNFSIKLDIDDINFLSENFKNGTFIDGFIHLKSNSEPDLSLPFTGFYGLWQNADIFEPFLYSSNKKPSLLPSFMADSNQNIAGLNSIAKTLTGDEIAGMPSYSPNGDNILDNIVLMMGFKRKCQEFTAEIYRNHKLIYSQDLGIGSLSPNGDEPIYKNYPIDWQFPDDISDGEVYTLRLTAKTPEAQGGVRKEIISQQFTVDLTEPKIEECRKITINDGNSEKDCLMIKMSDNSAVQGAVIVKNDENVSSCSADNFYSSNLNTIIELPEDTSDAYVEVYDMAGNHVTENLDKLMNMAKEEYKLSIDDNLYYSTKDKSFGSKIKVTDKNGKEVKCTFSSTPTKIYENSNGLGMVSVSLNSCKLTDVPVMVGLAGDANLNGITDLLDLIMTSRYLIYKANPNGTYKNLFADFEGTLGEYLMDFDQNGVVDFLDLVSISRYMIANRL